MAWQEAFGLSFWAGLSTVAVAGEPLATKSPHMQGRVRLGENPSSGSFSEERVQHPRPAPPQRAKPLNPTQEHLRLRRLLGPLSGPAQQREPAGQLAQPAVHPAVHAVLRVLAFG